MVRNVCLLVLGFVAGCSRYELTASWNELRGDAYPLDGLARELPEGATAQCPADVATVLYRGEHVQYSAPVQVAEPFVDKLRALELVVGELGTLHFGRAPDRLLHYGTRVCRTVRGSSRRLSEHAFGNAIDVSGFEWKRTATEPARRVSVLRDWSLAARADPEAERRHRFLRAVVERVLHDAVFRGVIGPGREGHADHFHFDQAPWSYTLF